MTEMGTEDTGAELWEKVEPARYPPVNPITRITISTIMTVFDTEKE
jgi:hypothetical protein